LLSLKSSYINLIAKNVILKFIKLLNFPIVSF
jgi:hypothetical protein